MTSDGMYDNTKLMNYEVDLRVYHNADYVNTKAPAITAGASFIYSILRFSTF